MFMEMYISSVMITLNSRCAIWSLDHLTKQDIFTLRVCVSLFVCVYTHTHPENVFVGGLVPFTPVSGTTCKLQLYFIEFVMKSQLFSYCRIRMVYYAIL